ncbi:uncharacterized protein LOC125236480 isoform X2 [Leguminivora glycinivorella]|uniref:uncharacterized protein LOC125236480 isoform X2 n=1 Tax=Leguminivora glycinivorella TaxID=1035111 RepID=UPI00200EAFD9|nr:uncharacterized protein LOC125236480 isoform X2 [Leguminivora glycinivorella]
MYRIAVVIALFEVAAAAPSPLRVTINCGSHESDSSILRSISRTKAAQNKGTFDVSSFCDLIHNAIPKAVQDGRFVVADQDDMDQEGYGDTQSPISIAPPKGYIPKLGLSRINKPKLRIPAIKVPRLDHALNKPLKPPVLGSSMIFKTYRDSYEEPTSAEKMEQFKKGVQKMLHFVKILGQVDQYLTERTKIVIDKLSKTFAE